MGLRINETVAKKTPAPTSGRTIIQDDELAGFGLQVTAKGVRSFFIRYRINGRQLFYTIGQYPQWSAQAAREQAKTLKKHIDVGVDPLAKRRADVAATKKAAEPLAADAPGTVGWLIKSYKSTAKFRSLAEKTRFDYSRQLERLAPVATLPLTIVDRQTIRAIRDQLGDRPRTRQLFGQVCSLLFNYGIKEHDIDVTNPAQFLKRDGKATGYLAWSAEEMALFEVSQPPRHVMSAYMIGRYTGPRRGDIVSLKRSAYTGDDIMVLSIDGSKTSNPVKVRVHKRLREYLDGLPGTDLLICDGNGLPILPGRLTKDMRKHLNSIGLKHLHLHGLRHTAGKALAEAGCSSHEIQAVLGHKTLQMVAKYTEQAKQATMAGSAVRKLERGSDGE